MPKSMPAENPIRVVMVDDHAQIHRIVHVILGATTDINLVGQGANGQAIPQAVRDGLAKPVIPHWLYRLSGR